MSNLHQQLKQPSDLLSDVKTDFADKEKALQYEMADKEQTIENLQTDIKICKAELNDIKDLMSKVEMERLSVVQELEEKIETKDEMIIKLKEELIAKQDCLDFAEERHSASCKKFKRMTEEESHKIASLEEERVKEL